MYRKVILMDMKYYEIAGKSVGKSAEEVKQLIQDIIDDVYQEPIPDDIIPHKGDKPTVDEYFKFWVKLLSEYLSEEQ